MTITGTSLARLLTWLSPAFPTGGYAYSHGLEWAVEASDVTDRDELTGWITELVTQGSLWTDCILLRHACVADDPGALRELADFACACAASRERQEEMLAQGAAFRRAIAVWQPGAPDETARWPLAVALGDAFRREGIDADTGCLAALQAAVASLVSAAVRLVPLGQTDGLRVIAALEETVHRTAWRSRGAGLDEVGGCCLRADIAAMRHETQPTRLFRT